MYNAAETATSRAGLLRNLRFGVPNGLSQQRLVSYAGKEDGNQIALRALDGPDAELRVTHDVGNFETARRGLRLNAATYGAQAAVARAAVHGVEILSEVV